MEDKIKQIAEKYGYSVETDKAEDGTYSNFLIQGKGIDLDVIAPRRDNEYLAYGIESTSLPREIYYNVRKGFTEQARSDEILETVKKILAKELVFHPKPGLLNKNAGYILLPIDGEERKIPQKNNFFSLPVSEA